MNRREFLKTAAIGAAAASGFSAGGASALPGSAPTTEPENAFKYRIAFGAWMNDMRLRPLPLEDWPQPQFDDVTVESLIRTMDVQRDAGFNMFDVWGFFATFGWPVDITSAVDADRRKRIEKILAAAEERNIALMHGMGTYSWG